jgi:polysaccharide pyruvyl transferase WcaK-like protein
MKIAIFGYYNALNAGDDRLQFCITRLFQGHTLVFLPHYLPPPVEYLQSFDWLLIGGGGLVFEQVGVWCNTARWLKQCRAKVGVLGVGVNHIFPELLNEVTNIIDASEFFYVRDCESKALLNHPKVQVYPDLSWCFPLQREGYSKANCEDSSIALNLLPCHWKNFEPEAWVAELSKTSIHPFPLHFGQARDADLLSQYYEAVPSEFSLEPLINSQLLVACRFHAIIFAMQLGKPFVAINYDHKVKRLLTEADLLECCLETDEPNLLLSKIDFVLSHQAMLQEKIAVFVQHQRLQANVLYQKIQDYLAVFEQRPQGAGSTIKRIAKKLLLPK